MQRIKNVCHLHDSYETMQKKTIDVVFAMKVRDSSPKQNPKSAKSSKERLGGYL